MVSALAATATGDLWRAWSFDPLVLVGAAVAIAFFAQGWRRLRGRRPELAPWSRWPIFLAGVAIVVLGIVSPLDAVAEEYLQSAHMLQHVLIADLGVALALVAVRGPLSMFFLPQDLLAPLARRVDQQRPDERADDDERQVLDAVEQRVAKGGVVEERDVPRHEHAQPQGHGDARPEQERE